MIIEDMPAEDLERLIRPESWGVRPGEDGLLAFPDGTLWADPQGLPAHLRQRFGDRVRIMGFWSHENPCARLLREVADRHDFAVLDGCWIMDAWLPGVHGVDTRSVIHISEIERQDNCHPLYGDPGCWEQSHWLYPEYRPGIIMGERDLVLMDAALGEEDAISAAENLQETLTDVSADI